MAEAGIFPEDRVNEPDEFYTIEEIKSRIEYIRTNTGEVGGGKQTICPICRDILAMSRIKLQGGIKICEIHLKEAGYDRNNPNSKPFSQVSLEEIKESIRLKSPAEDSNEIFEQRFDPVPREDVERFKRTKQIGQIIAFDDENKNWALLSPPDGEIRLILPYDTIIGFELIEDGKTIEQKGLGRAVAGGLLFGAAGAIVGAVTTSKKIDEICRYLRIKITLDDIIRPAVYADIITETTPKETVAYQESWNYAQEIIPVLQNIIDKYHKVATITTIEEVKQFKELLDLGIITEEEFVKKKKELLGDRKSQRKNSLA